VKRFLQIIDGFYRNPDRLRQKALAMNYAEPENLVGLRSHAYQMKGVKILIESTFKIRIKYWETDLTAIEACNGVFFSSISRGPNAETVGIHYDDPPNWAMLLVYLTPNAPYDAGTSLWQHRKTKLIHKPTQRDARRLGVTVEKLESILERDSSIRNRWTEIDRIGNVYNRALLFPNGFLHSATRHFGSNLQNGRIYQSFHFPVKPYFRKY
jgi:hypothetical protein